MGSSQETSQPLAIQVESKVVAVALYPDQAMVTRRGQVDLDTGHHTLAFEPLPTTLQSATVMLVSRGASLSHLRDVGVHPLAPTAGKQAHQKTLAEAVQRLEGEYHRAKDSLTHLQVQRDFLQDLAHRSSTTFALGLSRRQVSLEDTEALLQFLGKTQAQLLDEIAQAEAHKQGTDQQLQAARQALEVEKRADTQQFAVTARVEILEPGTYEFDLLYMVSGVYWKPFHHIRLQTAEGTLQLTRLAQVEQTSGEDWYEVTLTLITGQPPAAIAPAPPAKWLLSLPPQVSGRNAASQPIVGGRSRSPSLDETYRMLGALPGSELPPLEDGLSAGTSLNKGCSPISLSPAGLVTLHHQTGPVFLEVDSDILPCELVRLALPQAAPHPYLQVLLNQLPEGLLPGPVKLFRDQTYLGETQLPALQSDQPLTLSFGMDDQIYLVQRLVTRDRICGPNRQETFCYSITLRNTHPKPQDCSVRVHMPISQHDQIKVSLTKADPPALPSEAGQCHWAITLEASEERTLHYEFVVEGPEDTPIVGLDN